MTMVKETRIIFDMKDIVAFRLRHESCGGEMVHRLDDSWVMPAKCPICNDAWVVETGESPTYLQQEAERKRLAQELESVGAGALLTLLRSALDDNPSPDQPLTLRFEIADPEES